MILLPVHPWTTRELHVFMGNMQRETRKWIDSSSQSYEITAQAGVGGFIKAGQKEKEVSFMTL